MATRDNAEWRRSGRQGNQSRYEGRRELIAHAARTCYASKGVDKTSIADIARELNITRELFYYYFDSKDVVTEAVVDSYVTDFAARLATTLELTEGLSAEELVACGLGIVREWLATGEGDPTSMLGVLQEAGRASSAFYRVATLLSAELRAAGLLTRASDVDGLAIGLCGAICVMLSGVDADERELAQALAPLVSGV